MAGFRYKHIIWDWNGTLLDDIQLCLDSMNPQLAERGLPPLEEKQYKSIFRFPVQDYYSDLGFDFETESFETVSDNFMSGYRAKMFESQLHEGVRKTLNAIGRQGISQSILTASYQGDIDTFIEHFKLDEIFTEVVGIANSHAESKVAAGKDWIAESGLDAADILLIGDTTHDYEVAKALGMDCWYMGIGHQSREQLARSGIRILESLAELLEIIEEQTEQV